MLAFWKADGFTVALHLGRSGDAVKCFTVVAGQIGPKGTSAVVGADLSYESKPAATLFTLGTCWTAGPISFTGRADLGARAALPKRRKTLGFRRRRDDVEDKQILEGGPQKVERL